MMERTVSDSTKSAELDAVVVGAGFAGLYALYRLRNMGLKVRVLESGDGVGGTWYWNRYPGARCDFPSIEYSFGFSDELQQAWSWTETMASQAELLAYANHVVERFALRDDIQLNTTVTAATFDQASARWVIETADQERFVARYCVMATGCLSVPITPKIPGQETFAGISCHTARWPSGGIDFDGKRVGVIGTGSSGVQVIPEIAKQAKHLFVFQRTPVYTFPAHNRPMDPAFEAAAKANYAQIRALQRRAMTGVARWRPNAPNGEGAAGPWAPNAPKILEATEEEKQAALERHGFGVTYLYADVRTNPEANAQVRELYRRKLREIVTDPEVAEGLSPREVPVGCKRAVYDTDYYVTFNRPNVTLVDLRQDALQEITPWGVKTAQHSYELDVLVYASGFDAMTGALNRIRIEGSRGTTLKEHWAEGARSYLGIQVAGFPNLFTITGPGSPSVISNVIVSIEQHVDWIADCITYLHERGLSRIEPTVEAEEAWVEHVDQLARGTMWTAESCNSWYLGANVPGKPRKFMPYIGGLPRYHKHCEAVVAAGYEGFALS